MIPDRIVVEAAKAAYLSDNCGAEEWAAAAWEDMGGSEPSEERARLEINMKAALEAVYADIQAEAQEAASQRLRRALFAVDGKHHLRGTNCLCGFHGDARARTQTEHITNAVLSEYVRADELDGGAPTLPPQ